MLFDAHIHFDGELSLDDSVTYFKNFFDEFGVNKVAVLACCNWTEETDSPISNFKAIWLKKMMPDKMFAYMSLRHDLDAPMSKEDYYEQLCDGIKMGFDGIKFLDGKPDIRKRLSFSLSDERYDLVFEKLEKDGFPIVYHVADPEKFWHDPTAFCYYGDDSFRTKEQLYGEIDELLCKFPDLKLTFAHFYFLAAELERAADFLDKHKNVCFDLAPGREMFHELAQDIPAAREFFKKYKNRIIWGSDINNTHINDGYCRDVYKLLNGVLSDGEPFFAVDADFTPLGIDDDSMSYIRYKNQVAITGENPTPINEDAVRECIEKFRDAKVSLSEKEAGEFARIASDFGVKI